MFLYGSLQNSILIFKSLPLAVCYCTKTTITTDLELGTPSHLEVIKYVTNFMLLSRYAFGTQKDKSQFDFITGIVKSALNTSTKLKTARNAPSVSQNAFRPSNVNHHVWNARSVEGICVLLKKEVITKCIIKKHISFTEWTFHGQHILWNE